MNQSLEFGLPSTFMEPRDQSQTQKNHLMNLTKNVAYPLLSCNQETNPKHKMSSYESKFGIWPTLYPHGTKRPILSTKISSYESNQECGVPSTLMEPRDQS